MERQQINRDGSENENRYIDVYNVRISLVEKTDPEKDWEGATRYLRFSAYTGQGNSVMQGPELPLTDENILSLVRAIMALSEVSLGGQRTTPV
ncbi:MAG: hypothetical protein ABSD63_02090 [Candidatus Korobacteraceae bacterium]|jgi:hypothetical protein